MEQIYRKYNLKREEYDINLMQKILKDFLDAEGIAYMDLSDEFSAEGQKGSLYKLRDTHWNEAGNILAAEIIFKCLVKKIKLNNE
ncbi:MAG: hypothetical protein WCI77_00905 [Candidatus Omnitrophota bacterium]